MDKLTAIKIKYDDGTYSDEIPVSVLAENVEWDSTHTLVDVLGNVDSNAKGTVQDQIDKLFNEKVSTTQLNNYVASQLNTDVTNWLNNNVNPVGSAVVVDSSLSVSGAAADAKVVGDLKRDLKSDLTQETNARTTADNALSERITDNDTEISALQISVTNLGTHKVAQPLDKYNQPTDGADGQSLRTKGDGTTEWVDVGLPTDAQTSQAVSDWLDEHPEATTTVQDGSITEAKFSDDLKLKSIKDYVTPEMFGAVGDGVTDDSEAVQKAINDGRPVRGFNSYFLDSTIDILTNNKNIEFFGTLTSNKTPAVRISTSSSVIKIKRIETTAQDGVCVLFDGTSRVLTYNKFAFSELKAGTQSNPGFACIHILTSGKNWFNENRIDCGRFISGLWGIYADGSNTTSSYSCIEGNLFVEPIIENNHYGIYLNFCYNTTIILSRNSPAEISHFITTDGVCTGLTIFNRYTINPKLYNLSSGTIGRIVGGLPASGSSNSYLLGYGVILIKAGRLFNPGNELFLNLSSYEVNGTVDLNTIDALDDFYQPTVMYLSDSTTTLILNEHYGINCGINEFSIRASTSRPLNIQKNGSTVLTIPKLMGSGGITKVYYDDGYGWYYTFVDGNRKLGYEKPTTKTVTIAGLVFVISKSGYIVNVSISSGSFDNTYTSGTTLGNISENGNFWYNPTTTVQIINAYSADSRISIAENGTIKVLTNNSGVGQGDLFRGSLTYMTKV